MLQNVVSRALALSALCIVALFGAQSSCRAVTATLEYGAGSGAILEACDVNLTSGNSVWETVDFYANKVGGSQTKASYDVGVGGAGDHRYPTTGMKTIITNPSTGDYDLYAVAHGHTNQQQPNPPILWDASTTTTRVTIS